MPDGYWKDFNGNLVPRRRDVHPAIDEVTRNDNANSGYELLDWALTEFIQCPNEPPGYDNANNMPLEIEALFDPATYEYEYELGQG